jgi:hypothetical protein
MQAHIHATVWTIVSMASPSYKACNEEYQIRFRLETRGSLKALASSQHCQNHRFDTEEAQYM